MNERVKELAQQAGVLADYGEDIKKGRYSIGGSYQSMEKFAELIVRECMNIAKNWEDQLENANSLKESNAVGIVAYRIARQFGVKQ